MNEQWKELKETIIEMRDSEGTCTQQETCKFLVALMNVLEKQKNRLTNSEWIDFLSEQFEISRTSAKDMLHIMMSVKAKDNLKKRFNENK